VMHPLLPVVLPLVITAIILSVVFAWLFPAGAGQLAPVARFTHVTDEAGLHLPPLLPNADSPTTLGGAVAVLDYNGDGAPDLLFVNGAPWPWEETLTKRVSRGSLALWRNDGHGHFDDVTARADLNVELQGMAVAVGDFDNDGRPDIFITCVGPNHLFRNRGDGRFEDVTESAGVGGEENTWSTGATWLDYDNDGRLDLVVAHYARWPQEVGLSLAFTVAQVGRSYGTPTGFVSAFPTVYRNLGDGRFELVPGSAGLHDIDPQTELPVAKPLAIVPVEANGDGKLDLLFSYHTSENALFLNQGDGTFRQWSASRDDRHEGTAAGFASASALPFAQTAENDERFAALQSVSLPDAPLSPEAPLHLSTKFAVAPGDFNLDGRFEIFSGQGRAEPDTNKFESGREFLSSPQLLWKNAGRWQPAPTGSTDAESGNRAPLLATRGVATADFDGDGDLDVVLAPHEGAPVLLRNDQRLALPWLRLRLIATRSQPEAGGARVEIHTPRRVLVQTVAPAMGFMAQSESTLTFGLGDDARVRKIVVHWPSGQRQELRPEAINRTLVLREP
jgi:enediyne biosynthesis protein E4